ncbi:MAG: hypothetical protein FH758_02020 [Firmicutes bacterium]|nr:hypothetical protein [Bacillota bacterium]
MLTLGKVTFEFKIDELIIDSIGNSSSLNVGRNTLNDFESMVKTNQGLGKISGNENKFPENCNYVEDPDDLDMFFGDKDKIDKKLKGV